MRFTRYDQVVDSDLSNEILGTLASLHLSRIYNQEHRERIKNLIAQCDWLGLCEYELDYGTVSVADAIEIRQVLAFYTKREDLGDASTKGLAAYSKFVESEDACRETNVMFRAHARGRIQFPPHLEAIYFAASKIIARILGPCPSLENLKHRFGKGATTQIPKRKACPREKLGQVFACSGELTPLLEIALEQLPHLLAFNEEDVAVATVEIHHGRFDTVPKTPKTDRSISVEPWLNGFFQLGIGDYMTARLKEAGIDLSDQTRNQTLARLGSINGELATLDLSSASDTISTELVAHLLPLDWYLLLSRLRTGTLMVPSELRGGRSDCVQLEKFSTMGNGFTFPLESLLFYALVKSACRKGGTVSVYGDDIICPSSDFNAVVEILKHAGFTPNVKKSFSTGSFRESCGGDYLSGINIRPSYIKGPIQGATLFVLHNEYARRFDLEAASIVLSHIAEPLRIWGPDGYGDGHLITGDYQDFLKAHRREYGYAGYTFDTYTFSARRCVAPKPGDYVFPLYSIYINEGRSNSFNDVLRSPNQAAAEDGQGRPISVLPGTQGYKRIKIYTLVP